MRLYSRALLRRIMRGHIPAHMRFHGTTSDVYIYLAYLLFLHRLADEARLRVQMDSAAGVGAAGARAAPGRRSASAASASSSRQILRRHVLGAGRAVLRQRARPAHTRNPDR